jgi:O-antigen/teichoic acid export membrane protein
MSRRRGANALFAASLIAQGCTLLRYTALARLLGPEQLGLAATLILTVTFFELAADTGSDRFLILENGDQHSCQRLAQLVLVVRGLLIAAALVAFAVPLSAFYKRSDLATGFMFVAISPLISGFLHLDFRRVQRKGDFRPESLGLLASEIASLVVTLVAAFATRNFTAVLYGLIARALVLVTVSHMTAERRYEIGYSPDHAARLARFSLPLMLNGLILFLGGQGDRFVVASQIGVEQLGYYSAVTLLVYYPSGLLLRYIHAIYLPVAAREKDLQARKSVVEELLAGTTLLLALAMAAGFTIVGPPSVVILYGAAFTQPALLVGLIGILQACRFLIVWPTTIALAGGRSGIVLISNMFRLVAWPASIAAVHIWGGLFGIVTGFITGELAALVMAFVLLSRSDSRPLLPRLQRLGALIFGSAILVGWIFVAEQPSLIGILLLLSCSIALIGFIFARERVSINGAVRHVKHLATLTAKR